MIRRLRAALAGVAAGCALAACAHPAPAPAAPHANADACGAHAGPVAGDDAILCIRSSLPDADVILDGRVLGRASRVRGGLAIEAGYHQLELWHDDYFSAYFDLQLARAERKHLVVELQPILP